MTIGPHKLGSIHRAYRTLTGLLAEGESASSLTEMATKGDPRWQEPEDDKYTERVCKALNGLLNLAEVTESYRTYVRAGFQKIYGQGGCPGTFIMSMISGALHISEKLKEVGSLAALPTEAQATTLLATGQRSFDPRDLTFGLFDSQLSEPLERETFKRYEAANRDNASEKGFINTWRRQIYQRYTP